MKSWSGSNKKTKIKLANKKKNKLPPIKFIPKNPKEKSWITKFIPENIQKRSSKRLQKNSKIFLNKKKKIKKLKRRKLRKKKKVSPTVLIKFISESLI